MFKLGALVPIKFLSLISHMILCISTLNFLAHQKDGSACTDSFCHSKIQFIVGLSITIAFILFELLLLLGGFTMFSSESALISSACHAMASIHLIFTVFEKWQVVWFWLVFTISSVIPLCNDFTIFMETLFK